MSRLNLLALITAVGITVNTYGQGVLIWNIANSGGLTATAGGLIYTNTWLGGPNLGLFDGINLNLGIEVYGGNGAANNFLGRFTAANDPKGYTGFDYGKFQAGNAVTVPGVAGGGIATIRLDMWIDGNNGLFQPGLYPNYAAAAAGGGIIASATFQNPTGNPFGSPPFPDQQLTGMPSMYMGPLSPPPSEPSSIVLAGLGILGLLIYRRFKRRKAIHLFLGSFRAPLSDQ